MKRYVVLILGALVLFTGACKGMLAPGVLPPAASEPALPTPTPAPPAAQVSVAFETTFAYSTDQNPPSRRTNPLELGRRVVYSVAGSEIITDTAELGTVKDRTPKPIAIVVENNDEKGYALIEIGEQKLISSLVLSPTHTVNLQALCAPTAPTTVFASSGAMTTTLTIATERADGLHIPLEITKLGRLREPGQIADCSFAEDLVAVFFAVEGNDQALYVVASDVAVTLPGPWPWPRRCWWPFGCSVHY